MLTGRPGLPVGPISPVGPARPFAPRRPLAPAGPAAPVAPCAPVSPAGPLGPCVSREEGGEEMKYLTVMSSFFPSVCFGCLLQEFQTYRCSSVSLVSWLAEFSWGSWLSLGSWCAWLSLRSWGTEGPGVSRCSILATRSLGSLQLTRERVC